MLGKMMVAFCFFDTDEYYRTGKMDGVSVKTVDLNINIGG